jgi:ribosomal protein S17E
VAEVEFPKLDPFKVDIDAWLAEDKKAKRKQRHTAKRVYQRLVEKYSEDFTCSYRAVAGYVAKKVRRRFSAREPAICHWNTSLGKLREILAMLNTMKTASSTAANT